MGVFVQFKAKVRADLKRTCWGTVSEWIQLVVRLQRTSVGSLGIATTSTSIVLEK